MPARPYLRARTRVRRHAIVPLAVILAVALTGFLGRLDDHDVERSALHVSARTATGLLPAASLLTGRSTLGDGPCRAPALVAARASSLGLPAVDGAPGHVGPSSAVAHLFCHGPLESRPPPYL